MTFDEAIKHAEEVADKKEREKQKWERWLEHDNDHRAVAEKVSCELCAEEHRQLAEWLKELKQLREQEPSRDMEEIEEVINCDADAETKCKMISNILTANSHYFDEPQESEKINCKATKCENCQNHNYCDFEPQESEE